MMIRKVMCYLMFFVAGVFAVTTTPAAWAQSATQPASADAKAGTTATIAPDALVQQVVDDVLAAIKKDPAIQAGNQARINEVIDKILLGRFDFRRMTILAMGKNWRGTTPEQQKALVDAFQTLLVRTYSRALTQFKDDKITVKPLRTEADAKDITVYSEFQRKSEQPIPVDYSLIRGGDGQWRCYDIVVGGVSLVTNYRDDFNARVKESGIDGLIKALNDKNRALTPDAK